MACQENCHLHWKSDVQQFFFFVIVFINLLRKFKKVNSIWLCLKVYIAGMVEKYSMYVIVYVYAWNKQGYLSSPVGQLVSALGIPG